jgi:hypothetical protein
MIIDTDRMLAFAVTGQCFQLVVRRYRQIAKLFCRVHHVELAKRDLGARPKLTRRSAVPPQFCSLHLKRRIIGRLEYAVLRYRQA